MSNHDLYAGRISLVLIILTIPLWAPALLVLGILSGCVASFQYTAHVIWKLFARAPIVWRGGELFHERDRDCADTREHGVRNHG